MNKEFIELHRTEAKAAERCRLMNQGFERAGDRVNVAAVVPFGDRFVVVDLRTARTFGSYTAYYH